MKLHKHQRSKLAEAICKRLIKRRGNTRDRKRITPIPVYVIQKPNCRHDSAWGVYYPASLFSSRQAHIIVYYGPKADRREKYVVLVHELAHHIDHCITARKYRRRAHGETFQRILWGTLTSTLWKPASTPRHLSGASGHKPEFQPNKSKP